MLLSLNDPQMIEYDWDVRRTRWNHLDMFSLPHQNIGSRMDVRHGLQVLEINSITSY